MSLKEENLIIKYTGNIQPGQRFTKIGSKFVPIGGDSVDTATFEADMAKIIGDDANIPPVLVSGVKFYKCASVNTPQKQETETITTTDKPTYVVSNAGLSDEVNGTYTYMG